MCARAASTDEPAFNYAFLSQEERFAQCERLLLKCQDCHHYAGVAGVFQKDEPTAADSSATPTPAPRRQQLRSALFCPDCSATYNPAYVCNQIDAFVRKHISNYYSMELQCSDPSCGHESRQLLFRRRVCCVNPNVKCNNRVDQKHSAAQLYNQLVYYRSLFDVSAIDASLVAGIPAMHVDVFKRLYAHVDKHIAASAYHNVSMAQLFSFMKEQHHDAPPSAATTGPQDRH